MAQNKVRHLKRKTIKYPPDYKALAAETGQGTPPVNDIIDGKKADQHHI